MVDALLRNDLLISRAQDNASYVENLNLSELVATKHKEIYPEVVEEFKSRSSESKILYNETWDDTSADARKSGGRGRGKGRGSQSGKHESLKAAGGGKGTPPQV